MNRTPGSPRTLALLLAFAAPAVPLTGSADTKPAAPAPASTAPGPAAARTPPAELERLKFLVGNFNCDGTTPVKGSVDHAFKGRWVTKPTLSGFFLGWQYTDVKAKDHPVAYSAEGRLSWDGGLSRFLFDWADTNGTAALLRAEAPADVDKFLFKGTATASFGRHVPHQFTITRTDKGFDLLLEGADANGEQTKLVAWSCVKGK